MRFFRVFSIQKITQIDIFVVGRGEESKAILIVPCLQAPKSLFARKKILF